MKVDYRAIVDRWMRRVDEVGLLAAIDEIAAPGFVADSGMGARDLGELRARFEELAIAFPDATVTLEDVIVDGPKVRLVLNWQGTFLGPLRGFAANGRPVKFAIVMILRMSGFLVERLRIYAEAFTGPVQMGLIPAFDDLERTEGPI